jgi:hypothetical protein
MGRIAAVAMIVLVAAACASGGGGKSNCMPVPQALQLAGPVYRDCEVSRRAEPLTLPSIDLPKGSDGSTGCYVAWFDVVVDTAGHILQSTAKQVRTNNQPFAEAVKRALSEVRYTPAEKGAQRVAQLVRFKASIPYAANRTVGNFSLAAAGGSPAC